MLSEHGHRVKAVGVKATKVPPDAVLQLIPVQGSAGARKVDYHLHQTERNLQEYNIIKRRNLLFSVIYIWQNAVRCDVRVTMNKESEFQIFAQSFEQNAR